MEVKRIRRDGNALWPLPADYFDLDGAGQKQARLNACRQWLLRPKSLEDKGTNYIGALRFFDAYYLSPDTDNDFDPLFYPREPFATPHFHELISYHGAINRLMVAIGPRGGAKSMLAAKNMLLRMLTKPAYSYVYCTSTQTNAARMAEIIRGQVTRNTRLMQDFGVIAPKRGQATFSTDLMYFRNLSWVQYVSIDTRIRGLRPSCFQVDDPEWDPRASTPMAVVRQQMEMMLFQVILPTVMEESASVNWYATFVSKQHYAWIAAGSTPEGAPLDPRFEHWYRLIVRACEEDANGNVVSCWPEKWPATKDERLAKGLTDERYFETVSLEEIKSMVGPRVWQSEYMANPGQAEQQYFGDITEDRHGWYLAELDGNETDSPRTSAATIGWRNCKENVVQAMKLSEFLSLCKLFMTVDTSYTSGPASDYKAAAVMAIGPANTLFVLDLWARQCDQRDLEQEVWRMAKKWRVPLVGVEYVHQGISLYNALQQACDTRSQELAGTDWIPRVFKVKPGYTEKQAKIAAALGLRFHHGLIKLPMWARHQAPWRYLFNQIEEFNPDAHNGGLQHDDCLDAVAMSSAIIKVRVRMPVPDGPKEIAIEDLLMAGETEYQGVPLGPFTDWQHLPAGVINRLTEDAYADRHRGPRESKI